MTRITLPRATVEQALEALEGSAGILQHEHVWPGAEKKSRFVITALRAALVQEQATMTADDLADSIKRGEKWKVIGCIGHDCEECQTRIAKDALGNFQHQRKDA